VPEAQRRSFALRGGVRSDTKLPRRKLAVPDTARR